MGKPESIPGAQPGQTIVRVDVSGAPNARQCLERLRARVPAELYDIRRIQVVFVHSLMQMPGLVPAGELREHVRKMVSEEFCSFLLATAGPDATCEILTGAVELDAAADQDALTFIEHDQADTMDVSQAAAILRTASGKGAT